MWVWLCRWGEHTCSQRRAARRNSHARCCRHGVHTMTKRKALTLIVYAPALVGKDGRTLDVVHGMEKALPGLRLEWRLSEGGRPVALPQRDAWLVASIE